jgi:ribonuclease D
VTAPTTQPLQVVAREDELQDIVRSASEATRVAVDLEASGMFSYRARICAVQLAWDGGRAAVIDTLAVPLDGLRALLGEGGPVKIVHDVAFDARLLAEVGIELGHVHDTALAARMLGRAATGLASLLESELGVHIAKEMQRHDWRERPLDERMLAYLGQDVTYLAALDDKLWGEAEARGITPEVLEETRYRLASAVEAVRFPDTSPPYTRVKGVDRLAERELAVLRVVAELREREASRRDVPPHRVASNDALLAIARERPRTGPQVMRLRGIPRDTPDAAVFAADVAAAVLAAGETLPPEERARFERPRPPAALARARRERESRVLAWRREEARRREVDEQVILPGHCVKDAVERVLAAGESAATGEPDERAALAQLATVPGIGAFRIERYGAAIVQSMRDKPGEHTEGAEGAPP